MARILLILLRFNLRRGAAGEAVAGAGEVVRLSDRLNKEFEMLGLSAEAI